MASSFSDLFDRLADLLRDLLGAPSAGPRGVESQIAVGTPVPLLSVPSGDSDSQRLEPATDAGPARSPADSGGSGGAADEPEGSRAARFLLTVDDAGQFLVAAGDEVTLGHLRSGRADLLFLADVGAIHARLHRRTSLRDGEIWTLRRAGKDQVHVGGLELADEEFQLQDGDEVRLGENLSFRFRVPDPASHSVVLELLHGAECAGAERVLLLGEGHGGRLRIGAALLRHVRVPCLDHEVEIVRDGDELEVRCAAGVFGEGATSEETFRFPCPPPRRVDLSVGKAQGARPPFGLTLAPSELPGPSRGSGA
jgi:hypothetical protein